ncbi:beta-lactamase family protein [Micromonospora sp. CPCC 205371]|nr:beta-lactamase family protein [Micromonospora sp. CPCC 205371]
MLGTAPVVASGVLASATPAQAEVAGTGRDRIPRDLRPGGAFDQRLSQLAAEGKLSGTVLLAHKGKTVLERAYGMANARTSVRNGPDTAFALASVAKLFTAIAVSQLAERGQVDFGQAIGAYLDGFPASIVQGFQRLSIKGTHIDQGRMHAERGQTARIPSLIDENGRACRRRSVN